jgi:TM2 domain-containing membrane protein YozV
MKCGAGFTSGEREAVKSKIAAGLFGIFLGGFGVHRFYLGYVGIGILQIVVTIITLGWGGLWGFIEGILILTGTIDKDAEGRPLKE